MFAILVKVSPETMVYVVFFVVFTETEEAFDVVLELGVINFD